MADEKKVWWKSKTVWASILDFILNTYHLSIPLALQFGVTLPDVSVSLVMILNLVFGGLIVYGRTTATQPLSLTNNGGNLK